MKKLRTLYLVLADEGYRLLQTHEPGLFELPVRGAVHVSGVGHSETRTEQDRAKLAHQAAGALQAEWGRGTHERIMLSAPPKLLHELRGVLSKALHGHVTAELHKDLFKIPAHDLESHFEAVHAA